MRIEVDESGLIKLAYIYLTDMPVEDLQVEHTLEVSLPAGVPASINLDFAAGKLIGIEVIGAEILPEDLLAIATPPS